MRFRLKIELDNDAMQTGTDVIKALRESLKDEEKLKLDDGTAGSLWDRNGNTVGKWEVNERRSLSEIFAAIPVTTSNPALQGYCISENEQAQQSPKDRTTLAAIPAAMSVGTLSPEAPHPFNDKDIVGFCSVCGMRKHHPDANHIE